MWTQRSFLEKKKEDDMLPSGAGTVITKPAQGGPTVAQTPQAPQQNVNIPRPEAISALYNTTLVPEEFRDILATRKAGLQGFSAPELAAQRSQMGLMQGAAEKARQRALMAQMAKSGVRGGAAAAMSNRAAQLAAQERAAQAQQLFLKDIEQKQAAQKAYEDVVGGTYKAAGQRQFMDLAAGLTEEQLRLQERLGDKQAAAIEKYGTVMGKFT